MTPTPEQVEAVARAIVVAVVDESEHASANEEHSRPTDLRCLDDYPAVLREGWLRIAQAALAALPEEGWRPIETAPKDGTRILLWIVHQNAAYTDYPLGEGWVGPEIGHWTDHNGGGWTWYGLAGVQTHWMPLPSPPRDQQVSPPFREEKPNQSEGEGR